MAPTEVTFAQWLEVWFWARRHGYESLPLGQGKGGQHPVHSVSWTAVAQWCNALSERDGLAPVYRTAAGDVFRTGTEVPVIAHHWSGYRLPSAQEWEYAARGGLSDMPFPSGANLTLDDANHWHVVLAEDGSRGCGGFHPRFHGGPLPPTAPVGSLKANGFGLFDLAGNLWEFTHDRMPRRDAGPPPVPLPEGVAPMIEFMARGGCWGSFAQDCTVTSTLGYAHTFADDAVGFRLVRSSSSSAATPPPAAP